MLSCLDPAHTDGQLPLPQAIVFSSCKAFLTNSFRFFLNHPCCNSLNNFQLVDISGMCSQGLYSEFRCSFNSPRSGGAEGQCPFLGQGGPLAEFTPINPKGRRPATKVIFTREDSSVSSAGREDVTCPQCSDTFIQLTYIHYRTMRE